MKRVASYLVLPALACTLAFNLSPAWAGDLASLAIINQQTGERMQIWRHRGHNYVVGQPGLRYTLQVTNKTGARLLSVVAVDGINVITGATASAQQSGYVLNAWQQLDIAGWRKNMDEVAAFYFTPLRDSYAARTGRGDQTGVIGVALYREQYQAPPTPIAPIAPISPMAPESMRDSSSRAAEAAAPASKADAPLAGSTSSSGESSGTLSAKRAKRANNYATEADGKLGTGHGERIDSASRMTDFRRASSSPAEVLTVYYDSYANLVARGVIPRRTPYPSAYPSPFPGGFVPDPN